MRGVVGWEGKNSLTEDANAWLLLETVRLHAHVHHEQHHPHHQDTLGEEWELKGPAKPVPGQRGCALGACVCGGGYAVPGRARRVGGVSGVSVSVGSRPGMFWPGTPACSQERR